MAAQLGREVLIKVDTGSATFVTVTGGRSKSISMNQTMVDVTDADSTGQWRELLANGGVRSSTVTLSGIFKDGATEEDVRGFFMAGDIEDYQVIIPDFGTFEGGFLVTSLQYAGEYNGEASYSMTFESADALAWTAAV